MIYFGYINRETLIGGRASKNFNPPKTEIDKIYINAIYYFKIKNDSIYVEYIEEKDKNKINIMEFNIKAKTPDYNLGIWGNTFESPAYFDDLCIRPEYRFFVHTRISQEFAPCAMEI